MFRAIDIETGDIVYLERAIVETDCPQCGRMHQVDISDIILTAGDDYQGFDDLRVYCRDCTRQTGKTQQWWGSKKSLNLRQG